MPMLWATMLQIAQVTTRSCNCSLSSSTVTREKSLMWLGPVETNARCRLHHDAAEDVRRVGRGGACRERPCAEETQRLNDEVRSRDVPR